MQKKKRIRFVIFIFLIAALVCFLLIPKSIHGALHGLRYPFEVGEVIATEEIYKNTTAVLCTNKQDTNYLQNAIIRKYGFFYKVIDKNGSIVLKQLEQLQSGEQRAECLASWYDKGEHYFVMSTAYDKEIDQIQYEGANLTPIFYKGYSIFFGWGTGHAIQYQLYDQNGNELEHIKP